MLRYRHLLITFELLLTSACFRLITENTRQQHCSSEGINGLIFIVKSSAFLWGKIMNNNIKKFVDFGFSANRRKPQSYYYYYCINTESSTSCQGSFIDYEILTLEPMGKRHGGINLTRGNILLTFYLYNR